MCIRDSPTGHAPALLWLLGLGILTGVVAIGDLADWHAGRKIDVTGKVVAPGFIETPMTDQLTDEQKQKLLANVPAGRLGSSQEVAAAVSFLASEEAAYMTGSTLHVNGGMAML